MGSATISRLFVELGGDTKALNASLQEAIKVTQAAGIEATKSGKSFLAWANDALNPTVKLTEQIKLLTAAGKSEAEIFALVGDKAKAFSEVAGKTGQAVDPLVKKYAEMGAETAKAGFSVEGLGKTLTDFARNPVQAAQQGITSFLGSLGPVGVGLGAIAGAAIAAGAGLYKFMSAAVDNYERLENMSAMTGIAVRDLEAFEQIASEAGLSGLDLGRAISSINKSLGDTKANEFTNAMKMLGISTKDASGASKDAVKVLDEMRTALLSIEDPTTRAQLANQALGGRLRELIPLLLNSDKGLGEMTDELKKQGVVMGDMTNNKLKQYDAALDKLGRTWKALKVEAVTTTVDFLTPAFWTTLISTQSYAAAQLAANAQQMGESMRTVTKSSADERKEIEAKLRIYDAMVKQRQEDARKAYEQSDAYKEIIKRQKEEQEEYERITKSVQDLGKSRELAMRGQITMLEEMGRAVAKVGTASYLEIKKLEDELDQVKTRDPLGGLIPSEKDMQDSMKRFGDMGGAVITVAKQARNEISTVFSDMSRSIADAIIEWESPAGAIMDSLKSFGKAILRILIESFLNPLAQGIANAIGGLLGGKGAGGFNLGSLFGGAGGAGGAGGLGGIFGGGATATAGGAGATGAGATAGVGGFSLANLQALGQAGMLAIGAMMYLDSLKRTGAAGWAESMGGGAMAGFSYGGPIGAAIGAGVGGYTKATQTWGAGNVAASTLLGGATALPFLPFMNILGQSSDKAGSEEAMRDFGVTLGKDLMAGFYEGMGLSESSAYGIRKELLSSPKMLTEVLGPLAQANGQTQAFLKSLEAVSTSWGTFNLRTAYEAGLATGNFSELNKVWMESIGKSSELARIMPDFAEKLKAAGDAAKEVAESTGRAEESISNGVGALDRSRSMIDMWGNAVKQSVGNADALAEGMGRIAESTSHATGAFRGFQEVLLRGTGAVGGDRSGGGSSGSGGAGSSPLVFNDPSALLHGQALQDWYNTPLGRLSLNDWDAYAAQMISEQTGSRREISTPGEGDRSTNINLVITLNGDAFNAAVVSANSDNERVGVSVGGGGR